MDTKVDPTVSNMFPESKVVRNPRGTETNIKTMKAVSEAILTYSNKPETKFNYQLIHYAIWFTYFTGFRPFEVFMMRKSRMTLLRKLSIYVVVSVLQLMKSSLKSMLKLKRV